jgi:thymidylate synthase (FAD)
VDVGKEIPVLDHGYVKLITHWGSDEGIIEAARMSTDKGFKGWKQPEYWVCPVCQYRMHPALRKGELGPPTCNQQHETISMEVEETPTGDEKLLSYLWRNGHTSPFEQAGVIFEVKAPIFVFREWHRHRTQSYNEMSARYTPLPDENYVPTVERILTDSGSNKQAQGTGKQLHVNEAETFRRDLIHSYEEAEIQYKHALHVGVPKELARLIIPVGRYSKMRAQAVLWNWLRFLQLRDAPNAQYEIREYARVISEVIKELFPRTMFLYWQGRLRQEAFKRWEETEGQKGPY